MDLFIGVNFNEAYYLLWTLTMNKIMLDLENTLYVADVAVSLRNKFLSTLANLM